MGQCKGHNLLTVYLGLFLRGLSCIKFVQHTRPDVAIAVWLRLLTVNLKVAGSNPDGDFIFFFIFFLVCSHIYSITK